MLTSLPTKEQRAEIDAIGEKHFRGGKFYYDDFMKEVEPYFYADGSLPAAVRSVIDCYETMD